MVKNVLSLKTGLSSYYGHDNSIAVFNNGKMVFGCETERISRQKHGKDKFPKKTIKMALSACGLEIGDIDVVATTYNPNLELKRLYNNVPLYSHESDELEEWISFLISDLKHLKDFTYSFERRLKSDLEKISSDVPTISTHAHHKCHASSAFYPSGFDEASPLLPRFQKMHPL